MLSDAGAAAVLTRTATATPCAAAAGRAPRRRRGRIAGASRPGRGDRARAPAYVIYTSGLDRPAQGRPEHATARSSTACVDAGRVPARRRATAVLQKTPFGFDVSVWEFFWPLMTGAPLVVARPGGHRDPRTWRD